MLKRTLFFALAFILILSLGACAPDAEDYISGTRFDPIEYQNVEVARYENRMHGIIIEYPETYERVGNLDLDGYITFEGDGNVVSIYLPDNENNDILTSEEYVDEILRLEKTEESGNVKYGKSSGYKIVTRENGRTTVDFIVKGVDGFYRFAFTSSDADFTEEDETFMSVMGSIRIDDGIYSKLTRMSSRYTALLKYATSMQYITDANYANHSLNNYLTTKDERYKTEARNAYSTIRTEISNIINYERENSENYDYEWNKIISEAEKAIDACNRAEECVNRGDYEGAQKIARGEFTYALSDNSSAFLSIINTEISEY